ncbi:Gx transporter family protein [Lachnospiraceae bacterium 62-35]
MTRRDTSAKRGGKRTAQKAEHMGKRGMLVALAFIFSYIEALIPIPMPAPGMKLGLANLVTIVGLYTVGLKDTCIITLIRILLAGFTFGNAFSMWYSFSGAVLSLGIMIGLKAVKWFSPMGVSAAGGVGHNIGQLLAAAVVVENAGVLYYLPILMAGGVIAGGAIGLLGGMVIRRTERLFRL